MFAGNNFFAECISSEKLNACF